MLSSDKNLEETRKRERTHPPAFRQYNLQAATPDSKCLRHGTTVANLSAEDIRKEVKICKDTVIETYHKSEAMAQTLGLSIFDPGVHEDVTSDALETNCQPEISNELPVGSSV